MNEIGVTKKEELPYFFNGFKETCKKEDFNEKVCEAMLFFYEWMKKERETDLIVEYIGYGEGKEEK